MSFEGIDEWDENFLDEAIRIELEALSSRNLPSDPPEPTLIRPSSYADLDSSSRRHRDAIEPPSGRVQLHSEREPEPEPEPEPDSFALIPSLGLGARGLAFDARGGGLSFSPPRELSQRHVDKPNSEMDCEILDPWVSRGDRYSGGGITERDREVERLKVRFHFWLTSQDLRVLATFLRNVRVYWKQLVFFYGDLVLWSSSVFLGFRNWME
ncbi:hypothetical protein GW17_00038147 [Ensete ventricosum]|nr:hypothetical protein GW17_00038147 [Ensete ventricosum]